MARIEEMMTKSRMYRSIIGRSKRSQLLLRGVWGKVKLGVMKCIEGAVQRILSDDVVVLLA